MKFKLPVIKDNKIEEFEADFSNNLLAQMKWEREFEEQSKQESLDNYIQRINTLKESSKGIVNMSLALSALKAIYCFMDCDYFRNFKEFVKLMDFSNQEWIEKFTKVFNEIGEYLKNSSQVKN
jgi:hypothetical protein